MAVAKKISGFIEKSSWIRKMFEEGEQLRRQYGADKVFDFTLGNPDVDPPADFYGAFKRLANDPIPGMHRYMNNAGYVETRKAVAATLSAASELPVEADHVVMTVGAGGALNTVLKTILNPGDEVIILTPFFVEYRFYIDNHGGVPVEVWTDRETFQLDIDAIGLAINAKTRAIIVCSPNNPTGVIYPAESLKRLGELVSAKEQEFGRQICVISDEPYARIVYDGNNVPNIFRYVQNSVIVTSHSKDLALPGERIGYLAANPRMKNVGQFMEGTIFSNRVLGFVNAPALMQRLVAELQNSSVDIAAYQTKRDILYNALTGMGFEMVKPDGAFYFFPKSPLADDVEFVKAAQKHKILLVPGVGFGAPGYFRIAYCVDQGMIERSLPAWAELARELGISK
ncbi:pyridoxal phosphate-dependent aminotransferase [Geomesophilobacter sediminis]|uniref:Pyridoxal phosphate-dependent aminotransferase n=1 Tax=Geomesophilobacter sediminis TaxID=2798584 RepID=A0A8J7SC72_9BACT|nr:pyridoxal phosphate-dependent aminotransferase [Geomesophilobacter sediminis]MBJ6726899.1 pyridoxal phosphate-dependent aminotransferase [Geomesophilobacter sediminis]